MFIEKKLNKKSTAKVKVLYGAGINDADYVVSRKINGKQSICPYYMRWKNMIERCYCAKFLLDNVTYRGCIVCKEWLVFSVFKAWMKNQEWKGKHLDKDLLSQGNKVYSPKTCIFIDPHINTLLNKQKLHRGKYKIGVTWNKAVEKFQSQISKSGKNIVIGKYKTEGEAHIAFLTEKLKHIKTIAMTQLEPIRSALLSYKIE